MCTVSGSLSGTPSNGIAGIGSEAGATLLGGMSILGGSFSRFIFSRNSCIARGVRLGAATAFGGPAMSSPCDVGTYTGLSFVVELVTPCVVVILLMDEHGEILSVLTLYCWIESCEWSLILSFGEVSLCMAPLSELQSDGGVIGLNP